MRLLTKDELLNLMAGLPPSVMAMDEEETITTLAATVIEQQAEIERLREALAGVMDYAEEGALTINAQPALDAAYAALGATQ